MDINRLIGKSLRIGVLASALLCLAGLGVWVGTGSSPLTVASGSGISTVLASAFNGNASGLIYLGVAVLIATPIFRVALSSVYFAREKDRRYVVISLAVLSMLIVALISGSTG